MFSKVIPYALLFASILIFGACSVSRTSTTQRTAVEQALMSYSISDTVRAVDLNDMDAKTFFLKTNEVVSPDDEVVISMVRQQLLKQGLREAATVEEAELVVYLRADFSAIDDSEAFVGIPAIPVPVPGVGTVSTPELALYKQHSQYGRNKISFYAKRDDGGSLFFVAEPDPGQRHYIRYTILFLISFRTTNLPKPF